MRESRSWLVRPLLVAAALLVGAVSAGDRSEILTLESHRSLGGGRLAALLASPDAATAARAALAIGRTKQPDGVLLLERHLHDPRAAVRAFSIYGLGLIGLGSDAPAVTAAVRGDRNGAVKIAAIDALGRYEEARKLPAGAEATAVRQLVSAMAERRFSPVVRGRAAIALGLFAGSPAGRHIAAALATAYGQERDAGVRERIMWTIFRDYAAGVPLATLRAGLRDPDEVVRIEAVRAYGHLTGPARAAELQPLLNDRSWRVQEQTAESIRLLRGGTLTQHWTAIPAFVHVPPVRPDPYAALPALPRHPVAPGAPRPADVPTAPSLLPQTAAEMTAPAHGEHPRLRIVTSEGDIYVVLYPEWAPLTVTNFLNLMNRGFFDNNQWFRIVPDFVVQTGEQDAKNAPGPGYSIPAEENPLEQNGYVISMGLNYDEKTNTPIRDSAGSEYYITLSPQYHLDNAFTVFGAVCGGFDVLGRLTESDKVIRIERIADVDL